MIFLPGAPEPPGKYVRNSISGEELWRLVENRAFSRTSQIF